MAPSWTHEHFWTKAELRDNLQTVDHMHFKFCKHCIPDVTQVPTRIDRDAVASPGWYIYGCCSMGTEGNSPAQLQRHLARHHNIGPPHKPDVNSKRNAINYIDSTSEEKKKKQIHKR